MSKNRKIRDKEKEFKIPRTIVTICLVGLFLAYILIITATDNPYNSPLCVVIMVLAGALLLTLGIVIKMQDRRVDLDYDSVVVWKMCVVAGIILIGFAIFSLFI